MDNETEISLSIYFFYWSPSSGCRRQRQLIFFLLVAMSAFATAIVTAFVAATVASATASAAHHFH